MPVDRVTGDSTLKTVALFSPHISASSDYRFIYYYILLSSVSSLSLTNKHRGFVGDSKDDSKKCCHLCGWRNIRHFIPSTRPVTNRSVIRPLGCLRAWFTGCLPRQSADPASSWHSNTSCHHVSGRTPSGCLLLQTTLRGVVLIERRPVQFRTIAGIHRPALGELARRPRTRVSQPLNTADRPTSHN